jgi:metal-sulfur cluster biosynthetic enzyme
MTDAMHPESSVREPATGSPEPLSRTAPPVSGATPGSVQGASVAPPPTAAPNPNSPSPSTQLAEDDAVTVDQVRMTLRRVKDPDLNLNIIDLGLIYDVQVVGSTVQVDMSLTSPGCPSGPEIMGDAERQLREIPGVTDVTINLVWTPFWSPDRIEPRVRAYLGM